jgi:biopolymer transport protein ExbB
MLTPLLAQLDYWQLTLDGGLTNVFILLLSVIALATAIERFVNLRGDSIVSRDLITSLQQQWRIVTPDQLGKLCAGHRSAFAQLVAFLSRHRDRDYAALSAAVSDLASVEIRRHIQRVYPLALVSTLAPLAGLFGTVLGMVETFHTVAEVGNASNIGLLASGIYKALSTTAAGLIVAIPTLALYHYFRMRIRASSLLLEEGVNELLNDTILPEKKSDAHP